MYQVLGKTYIEWLNFRKKAARIILNKSSDTPSKTLFEELKWLDFEKRIIFQKCILMYKCLNDMAPGYLEEMFT